MSGLRIMGAAALLLGLARLGSASVASQTGPEEDHRPTALRDIGYQQRLGEQLPLDLELMDESGQKVTLGHFFHGRPVILSLVYYDCPMLCTLSLNGLVSALNVLRLSPGKDFELVTVSFDPRETSAQAAARKKTYLERYHRAGAESGWHFLTGQSDAVARLTKAVGFRYTWDEESRQFAHGTGIVVLTPGGMISRYLYGIEYAPKDLRLALIESSAGRLGTPADSFLLACYRYDPVHGRYGAFVMGMVRIAGAVTLLVGGGFLGVMLYRERSLGRPVEGRL